VLATLGLLPTDHPTGTGEFAAADATGLTDVPGVWVAGNVTDLAAGVVTAAAGAPAAGAAINADLIAEDTRKAIVAKFPRYPCLWPCLCRSRAGQRGRVMNHIHPAGAALDPDDWQIVVAAAPERQAQDPEGRPVTIRDAVLEAVRRRPGSLPSPA